MKKLMVKRSLIIFLLLVTGLISRAQMWGIPNLTTFDDRKIHFGFTLGLNVLDLGIQHYHTLDENPAFDANALGEIYPGFLSEIDSVNRQVRADIATLTPGFTVGIVSNLRLSENLDLRFVPGLSFGNRKLKYNVPLHDMNSPGNGDEYSLRATYIDFPFYLKYKSKRIVNQRPYMLGGLAARVDISKSAAEELVRLRKMSFYAEAGMGWDMYLQFFRLSTELKYSFGLGNNLAAAPEFPQPGYFNQAFKNLSAHMLTLSFHFE